MTSQKVTRCSWSWYTVSSTLHLDFVGNSYTIRTTISNLNHINYHLPLFLDTTKVEVCAQSC